MKTKTCKLYSRDFKILMPNIKINPYNFKYIVSKLGRFFEIQCIDFVALTLFFSFIKFTFSSMSKREWRCIA